MIRHTHPDRPARARSRRLAAEAGFTLAEVVVSLAVSLLLILSVLTIFEANARITRVQTDVADMQQNQRIAQYDMIRHVQMAGRGGLPMGAIPLGLAVDVRNDADADEHISPVDSDTPEVLDGTDVLTIRGVFSSPIYQLDYRNAATKFTLNGPPGSPTDGTVVVDNVTTTGVPQDLQPLIESIQSGYPEALVLVSAISNQTWAVVELDPNASVVGAGNPAAITVGFKIQGGSHTDAYATLSSTDPFAAVGGGQSSPFAYLGVLEEYRFYVREIRAGGELLPSLARAQTFPRVDAPYAGNNANWSVEIAENVFDLQVAYGIDTDGDGVVANGNLIAGLDPQDDEWLYNHPDDQENDPVWNAGVPFYLRVTNMVRTDRPDRRHLAPILLFIEDHDYGTSFLNQEEERAFRRRTLVTTVDLRNL